MSVRLTEMGRQDYFPQIVITGLLAVLYREQCNPYDLHNQVFAEVLVKEEVAMEQVMLCADIDVGFKCKVHISMRHGFREVGCRNKIADRRGRRGGVGQVGRGGDDHMLQPANRSRLNE